jgi:putative FmdB family regulatory protein
MPIYEYVCDDCNLRYERIVRNGDRVACPKCGSGRKTLQFSVFSSPRDAGSTSTSSSGTPDSGAGSGCGCTPSSCGCH